MDPTLLNITDDEALEYLLRKVDGLCLIGNNWKNGYSILKAIYLQRIFRTERFSPETIYHAIANIDHIDLDCKSFTSLSIPYQAATVVKLIENKKYWSSKSNFSVHEMLSFAMLQQVSKRYSEFVHLCKVHAEAIAPKISSSLEITSRCSSYFFSHCEIAVPFSSISPKYKKSYYECEEFIPRALFTELDILSHMCLIKNIKIETASLDEYYTDVKSVINHNINEEAKELINQMFNMKNVSFVESMKSMNDAADIFRISYENLNDKSKIKYPESTLPKTVRAIIFSTLHIQKYNLILFTLLSQSNSSMDFKSLSLQLIRNAVMNILYLSWLLLLDMMRINSNGNEYSNVGVFLWPFNSKSLDYNLSVFQNFLEAYSCEFKDQFIKELKEPNVWAFVFLLRPSIETSFYNYLCSHNLMQANRLLSFSVSLSLYTNNNNNPDNASTIFWNFRRHLSLKFIVLLEQLSAKHISNQLVQSELEEMFLYQINENLTEEPTTEEKTNLDHFNSDEQRAKSVIDQISDWQNDLVQSNWIQGDMNESLIKSTVRSISGGYFIGYCLNSIFETFSFRNLISSFPILLNKLLILGELENIIITFRKLSRSFSMNTLRILIMRAFSLYQNELMKLKEKYSFLTSEIEAINNSIYYSLFEVALDAKQLSCALNCLKFIVSNSQSVCVNNLSRFLDPCSCLRAFIQDCYGTGELQFLCNVITSGEAEIRVALLTEMQAMMLFDKQSKDFKLQSTTNIENVISIFLSNSLELDLSRLLWRTLSCLNSENALTKTKEMEYYVVLLAILQKMPQKQYFTVTDSYGSVLIDTLSKGVIVVSADYIETMLLLNLLGKKINMNWRNNDSFLRIAINDGHISDVVSIVGHVFFKPAELVPLSETWANVFISKFQFSVKEILTLILEHSSLLSISDFSTFLVTIPTDQSQLSSLCYENSLIFDVVTSLGESFSSMCSNLYIQNKIYKFSNNLTPSLLQSWITLLQYDANVKCMTRKSFEFLRNLNVSRGCRNTLIDIIWEWQDDNSSLPSLLSIDDIISEERKDAGSYLRGMRRLSYSLENYFNKQSVRLA